MVEDVALAGVVTFAKVLTLAGRGRDLCPGVVFVSLSVSFPAESGVDDSAAGALYLAPVSRDAQSAQVVQLAFVRRRHGFDGWSGLLRQHPAQPRRTVQTMVRIPQTLDYVT